MGKYARSLSTANRLLNKFGGTVFVETSDSVLHKGYGVFATLEYKDRPGNLTEEHYQEFWLSADIDYIPQQGDFLLAGTDVHIIVQVNQTKPSPQDELVVFELLVKL